MKKTLLALAVMAASSSVSAAEIYKAEDGSVNFYGQLRTEMKFFDENDHDARLGSGSSRAGVDAKYSVNNDLSVLGLVEFGVGYDKDDSTKDMNVRLHYAGLESKEFGTITFGKQWVTADDVYGADYSYFFGGSGLLYGTLSGAAHDAQIRYTLERDNFWVKAGVGLSESDTNQELYELFAGTSMGDLSVHAGFGFNQDTQHVVKDANKNEHKADLQNTYFEVTGEYSIGDALVGATYYYSKLEDNDSDGKIESNALSLAGTYPIADKTTVYGGYEYVHFSPNAGSNEKGNNVYLGTEYMVASWARVYAEYGYSDGSTLGFANSNQSAAVSPTRVDSESNFGLGARVYW